MVSTLYYTRLLWLCIKIKTEEAATAIKFLRIENDTLRKRERNAKDLKRDLQISESKVLFLSKKITLNEYLDKVSNYVTANFD